MPTGNPTNDGLSCRFVICIVRETTAHSTSSEGSPAVASLRSSLMNMMLMVAILVISFTPVYAQDQPNVAKLKTDAENVIKIINSDKCKLQTYCEFADLGDQIGQANEEQDTKKAEELSQKADELERN